MLFKRFADVDSIDIEVSAEDPDEIITVVKNIGVTFGGINLEDIKSPECFRIETELQELLDIPVFHDDQHGTAIICGRRPDQRLPHHRPRARGRQGGAERPGRGRHRHPGADQGHGRRARATCIAVDRKGVLYRGRTDDMNQWKRAHAVDTPLRTLAEAMAGADVLHRPVGQGRLHRRR